MQTEKISSKLIAVALVGMMLFAYNALSGETSKVDGCYPTTTIKICASSVDCTVLKTVTYDWDVSKSVNKKEVTLNQGEFTDLKYVVTAERKVPCVTQEAKVQGSIEIANATCNKAKNLVVKCWVNYTTSTWEKETKMIKDTLRTIAKKDLCGKETYNYDFTFKPIEGAKAYNLILQTSIDNYTGKDQPYGPETAKWFWGVGKNGESRNPQFVETVIDENATIKDGMTVPKEFKVSEQKREWNLTDKELIKNNDGSATKTMEYTVTLTNEGMKTAGTYKLTNDAILEECDNHQIKTASQEVEIITEQEGITLSGCVTAASYWNKKTSYDWKIEKKVDPSSWTFELGDSKIFNYTLTATRKLTNACSEEKGLTGSITVKNEGSEATKDLKIKLQLQAKEGGEFKNVAEAVQELTPAQIAAGKSQEYSYEFKQNLAAGTEYRVVANITTTNYAGSEGTANGINKESAKFSLPAKPNETKEDCEATVEDDIIDVDGFKIESDLDASDGIWTIKEEDLDKSGDLEKATKTYNVKVTNEKAEGGKEFTLKNEAALTEKDSKSLRTAQAQVLLKTKLKGITLDASLTTKGFWNKGISYDWKIEKKANPDYLRYKSKTSKEVQYTLTATRELDDTDEEHGIKGTIKVENKGDVPTENLEINVQVRYNKGDGYKDISSATEKIKPSKQIKEGGAEEYDYSIDFDPIKNAEYQVVATVTVTNYTHHLGDKYGIDEKEDVSFPKNPDEDVIDETAVVEDVFDVPTGFILTGELDDEWEIKEKDLKKSGDKWTAEKTYTINLENSSARYNNSYNLVNTATLKEEDSGRKSKAEEVVSILVKRTSSGGSYTPPEETVAPPVEPTPVAPPAPPAPPAPTPAPEPITPPAEPAPQLPNTGGETGLFIGLGMSLVAYGSWLRFK